MCGGVVAQIVGEEGSDTDVPSLSWAVPAVRPSPVLEGLGMMEALVLRASGVDMVALDLWLGIWLGAGLGCICYLPLHYQRISPIWVSVRIGIPIYLFGGVA